MPDINTHDCVIPFGKHNGERVTRLPIGYLKWASSEKVDKEILTISGVFPFWKVAESEIERRGERLEDVYISGHAIDRLSVRHYKIYREDRNENEGMYSWAQRMVKKCLEEGEEMENNDGVKKIRYKKIKWVIDTTKLEPVLKTAM